MYSGSPVTKAMGPKVEVQALLEVAGIRRMAASKKRLVSINPFPLLLKGPPPPSLILKFGFRGLDFNIRGVLGAPGSIRQSDTTTDSYAALPAA